MTYHLHLRMDVEAEDEVMLADRDFDTLAEVQDIVQQFLHRFGLPDHGPQTITVRLTRRLT